MIYRKSEYLSMPHGNSSVWRYMSDWKFSSLLNESSLFFPNANKLTDKYEVTVPKSTFERKRKELSDKGLNGRDLEEEMASFYYSHANPMKSLVLVNCWSVNPYENYALWKIYLGGEINGVAIKSTVSRLKSAVIQGGDEYPEEFFVGKVQYKKHLEHNDLARLKVITTKKPFYDFEKELRLFILNYPRSEGGTKPPYDLAKGRVVKVNLNRLMHQVYISPFSDESYKNHVVSMLNNSGHPSVKVRESEILDK